MISMIIFIVTLLVCATAVVMFVLQRMEEQRIKDLELQKVAQQKYLMGSGSAIAAPADATTATLNDLNDFTTENLNQNTPVNTDNIEQTNNNNNNNNNKNNNNKPNTALENAELKEENRRQKATILDLKKYILKSKVQPQRQCSDLNDYIKKTEIPFYQNCPDLNDYIKKTEIPPCTHDGFIKIEEVPPCPKVPDMSKYILSKDIPKCSESKPHSHEPHHTHDALTGLPKKNDTTLKSANGFKCNVLKKKTVDSCYYYDKSPAADPL
jgi:type II secretory pathway pseudopilin PulG